MRRLKNVIVGQDLVIIESDEDLKQIALELKSANCPDQNWDNYTKTNEEANQLFEFVKNNPIPKIDKPFSMALLIDQEIYGVVLSLDYYYDKKWHISISHTCFEKTPDNSISQKLSSVDESVRNKILNAFFNDWAPISNPGMVKEIEHFIGND